MDIVICGAGQVGSHAAEFFSGSSNNITIIDTNAGRLAAIADSMDVRTLGGNCATAETLREAAVDQCDLLLAATNNDEINLLSASIGKGLGAAKCIARVHHGTYFEQRGLDYQAHLGIDRLICPEFSTALAIARTLRNPGALAVEHFARGRIEMGEFAVSPNAEAVGKSLADLHLPKGTRLAMVLHEKEAHIPTAETKLAPGDSVILVGNQSAFKQAQRVFYTDKIRRQRVVILGGAAMAVWLSRALRGPNFSIRLFEIDPARSLELAEKLEWVTVIRADPTDPGVFAEERLQEADDFVALLDDDEFNILACAWAKSMGVGKVVAVVQRPHFLHLLPSVGIDHAFSPRMVAVKEIESLVEEGPLRRMASLSEGNVDVYQVRINEDAPVAGRALRHVNLSPNWVIAAIQHGAETTVPSADDLLQADDVVLIVGRHGKHAQLKRLFGSR